MVKGMVKVVVASKKNSVQPVSSEVKKEGERERKRERDKFNFKCVKKVPLFAFNLCFSPCKRVNDSRVQADDFNTQCK